MKFSRSLCTIVLLALTACAAGVPTPEALAAAKQAIPPVSGDYASALADATMYKDGAISFGELKARVLARKLPPHPLGDSYLFMSPPPPANPDDFTPLSMPRDWENTWGEIAMTLAAGKITEQEYDRLHEAAHPDCKATDR